MRRQLMSGGALAIVVLAVVGVFTVSGVNPLEFISLQAAAVTGGRVGVFDEDTAHLQAGEMSDTVCGSCHGNMRTDATPWHRLHMQQPFTKFTCSLCHKTIVKVKRSMNGKVLIDRTLCPTCHRQKFTAFDPDHQRSDWVKKHKELRGDKTGGADIVPLDILEKQYPECFICHRRKELSFCKDCHEFHPHNDQWINGEHGRTAVKTDFECLRCHEKTTWCTDECHEGVTLPHNIPKWSQHWSDEKDAPQWRKIHYKEASRLSNQPLFTTIEGARTSKDTFKICRRCHDSPRSLGEAPDFCMQCHHDRFYKAYPDQLGVPWWKFAMPFVKKNGADQCWKCHQPEFCVACHTTGTKAVPGETFVGWPDD